MQRDEQTAWLERLETMRRSVAMLAPGAPALGREDAMQLLEAVATIREELDLLGSDVARMRASPPSFWRR